MKSKLLFYPVPLWCPQMNFPNDDFVDLSIYGQASYVFYIVQVKCGPLNPWPLPVRRSSSGVIIFRADHMQWNEILHTTYKPPTILNEPQDTSGNM